VDVTREALRFPAPRSARLQMLARGETGGLMALGYSAMRGYGAVHPTVGELRVGYSKVYVTDRAGRKRYIGKIMLTEAEIISKIEEDKNGSIPYIAIGYGLCFGQNETKAICMGILYRAMRIQNDNAPATDQEFVLYHTEGVEAMGFTNHLKLPHYVTFQSTLDNLRKAIDQREKASTTTNQNTATTT
jgi:alpha-D-ribose 1-methylphosphonate 5-triphosphate synthase subunit PhnI